MDRQEVIGKAKQGILERGCPDCEHKTELHKHGACVNFDQKLSELFDAGKAHGLELALSELKHNMGYMGSDVERGAMDLAIRVIREAIEG